MRLLRLPARRVHVERAPERGADQLLRARLAVGADDADDRTVPRAAAKRRQARRARRACRAPRRPARRGSGRDSALRNDDASGALGHRIGEEVVRVEALPDQRDEQVARLDRSRVRPDAAEDRVGRAAD